MPAAANSPATPDRRLLARALHVEVPEVWVRFLLAIVGLGMAFAAALFSTVAREAGSLWGTLVLASAALLLAVVVGLTTVPYLARRVAAARLRDAFDYDVTRIGIAYVITVLLIGIAALNTGNNLLYIIVAAMLAAILVSGVASAVVLRDLELALHLPEHVFAGRPALGRIVLRNPRRWLPSFSVNVVAIQKESPSAGDGFRHFHFSARNARPESNGSTCPTANCAASHEAKPARPSFEGSAYFPYLPARSDLKADLPITFPAPRRLPAGGASA